MVAHLSMPIQLDEIDRHILQELQEDARISNRELASRVGLSAAPCLRRVRQLEQAGIIQKYVALLDPVALHVGVTVFVEVSLDQQTQDRVEVFEKAIARREEVLECYLMSGEIDYLLRVVVPDVASYERFLKEWLARVESVAKIRSNVAFRQIKYSTSLALESTREAEPAARGASKRPQKRRRP
jgi:Lrp/AsnC family leucine-responsive transcriptional regulator